MRSCQRKKKKAHFYVSEEYAVKKKKNCVYTLPLKLRWQVVRRRSAAHPCRLSVQLFLLSRERRTAHTAENMSVAADRTTTVVSRRRTYGDRRTQSVIDRHALQVFAVFL
jgi:hypothetical protein